jgi:hypothetical protein
VQEATLELELACPELVASEHKVVYHLSSLQVLCE